MARSMLCVVPDNSIKAAIEGICSRGASLQIDSPLLQFAVHPGHDAGCFREAHEIARGYLGTVDQCIVVFDLEGCGQEVLGATAIEESVESRMRANGWANNCRAIVIEPELEAWVWSQSPVVERELGWAIGSVPNLGSWLKEENWIAETQSKPSRPKEAFLAAIRKVKKAQSPAIFKRLAQGVSLEQCEDRSFLRLRETLKEWFSQEGES